MKYQWPSLIAHIDMDAFFASIEQRDNPELIGKPTVVTASGHSHIVLAASYEAKALGYSVGKRLAKGHNLHVRHSNLSHYSNVSKAIMQCLYNITPDIEIFSIDEAFLDLRGVLAQYNNELEIIEHIKTTVYNKTQLTCSIGLAANKPLAKIGSKENKPNGHCIIPPEHAQAFLYKKPIDIVCGIGPKMKQFLNEHGVKTCDQITNIPVSYLSSHFGQIGRSLWYAAQGLGTSDLSLAKPPKTMGHSKRLAWQPYQSSDIEKIFHQLTLKLCKRLRRAQLKALQVTISIHSQNKSYKRRFKLNTATHYQTELAPLYRELLSEVNWPTLVTQIGIRAAQLTDATQVDWLECEKAQPEDLMDLIDQKYKDVLYTAAGFA